MFRVSLVTPAHLAHPGLAIAAARAGGMVFLDIAACPDDRLGAAIANLDLLLKKAPAGAPIGIRLAPAQVESGKLLLGKLADRPQAVLVTEWQAADLARLEAGLGPSGDRDWFFEILDVAELSGLAGSGLALAGLVAKGNECGGWVGESSSFILAQQLLRATDHPVHVQGGIGPDTAAACLAAGAAGVVLDDQLWLMPESPLDADARKMLHHLNGSETILCGERLDRAVRVLKRPGFAAAQKLAQLAEEAETAEDPGRWLAGAPALLGWSEPSLHAWPMGQAVGMAAHLKSEFRTTGRLVRALLDKTRPAVAQAEAAAALAPDGPLARAHGTKYPIVQGPMTRVSDVAAFAKAVSQAGALPMLALALLRRGQVGKLLLECRAMADGRPWGVGILGFVPQDLRDEQLAVVREIKPPFALIAGGRPEQAEELEREGIHTYLHVPTPQLLEQFVGRGTRRFIFEGRECGGHVGPLSSFCLWEQALQKLGTLPDKTVRELHILFAGGIHDATSAAMISALAARLTTRGAKVGVLMGTAYLFTREAVACGAIKQRFQDEAVACTRTFNLETGPGHASRCVYTPFVGEFYRTGREMRKMGVDKKEISRALDELTLGRLRVASKGLVRDGDQIVEVADAEQHRQGMYMIGQAAMLRDKILSAEDLHREVSEGCGRVLAKACPAASGEIAAAKPSDIAIVGMSAILPGSGNLAQYWANILGKTSAVGEVPEHRWDWRLYFDERKNAPDKVYSKWGGFLEEFAFDPSEFGIPPAAARSIEPMQLLALEAVRRALVDAGCENGHFDRENTCVVFGASGGLGDLGQLYATRCELPRVAGNVGPDVTDRLPEWTGDSFPGILLNVIAGRVANRFDLGGANYVVDAACASSLASIESAVRELESGQANMAIAGGVDTMQSPFGYFCFSKTQALSARGKASSFDESADGIVISEGIGVLVLKRLADAERDGDRIYAVIKGFGSASDGRGASMTVPTSDGQLRALRKAYAKAGVSPASVSLYEAHGTGTALGDRVELESLSHLLREHHAAPQTCAVGSVKSLIGHTKGAAGVAGLIKAVLALHHRTLPPHAGVSSPLGPLKDAQSPVYMRKEAAPWVAPDGQPRRAGVSAFGFGGTNFHAVLEEYGGHLDPDIGGADAWPAEIFAWRARDRATLVAELEKFAFEESDSLLALAARAARAATGPAALAFTASSHAELRARIDEALAALRAGLELAGPNVFYREANAPRGKVAFLFPGQGSQYVDACREMALYFKEIRRALAGADRALAGRFDRSLSQFLYPPATFAKAGEDAALAALSRTAVAQPVIGALSCGILDVLAALGVEPEISAGHSYGEFTALHAAGVMDREKFFELSAIRGLAMQDACGEKPGGMAAVFGGREELSKKLAGTPLVIANHNSPRQTVVSGPADVLETVLENLTKDGLSSKRLPVSGAFHSELMRTARRPLSEALAGTVFRAPQFPVFANATAAAYPDDPAAIRRQLDDHLLSGVEFVNEIEAMHAAGVRVFVEVGPRGVLSALVTEILGNQAEICVVPLDAQRGSLKGFLTAMARLFVEIPSMQLAGLFRARLRDENLPARPTPTNRHWLLSGGGIRKQQDPAGVPGRNPFLSAATHTGPAPGPAATPIPQPVQQNVMKPTEPDPAAAPRSVTPQPLDTAMQAYADYQQTMRHFLSVQEEVMKQFLGAPSAAGSPPRPAAPVVRATPVAPPAAPSGGVPETPAPAAPAAPIPVPVASPQPAPSPEPAAATGSLTRDGIQKALLDLVSERTGYPHEMLDLDQDLEADLGIDSIKRVEIVGALQSILPPELLEALAKENQDLSRVRTLNGWIELLVSPGKAPVAQ